MLTRIKAVRPGRQEGATAVEYGLIAGLIAVAIIAALLAIGPQLAGIFGDIQAALTTANTSNP